MSRTPIAIVVGDLHLSHNAPVARAEKGEAWYKLMENYLGQLDDHAQVARDRRLPIVCCGDVFHKWDSPPELINFALRCVPKMYAIPGNHDLPYHNYNFIKRSAYWTLVETGVIKNLSAASGTFLAADPQGSPLFLYSFPTGHQIIPPSEVSVPGPNARCYAVVHDYVWSEGHSFPGAPPEKQVNEVHKTLKDYDGAFFGDNHKGFLKRYANGCCFIANCGGFIRRNSDERDYHPCVTQLMSDGTARRVKLDCKADKFIERPTEVAVIPDEPNVKELMAYLKDVDVEDVDFKVALRRQMDDRRTKLSKAAREIILAILEEDLK